MHFPHYRIQIDGSVLVWNSESEYLASFSERTSDAGWSYSEIDDEDNTISGINAMSKRVLANIETMDP